MDQRTFVWLHSSGLHACHPFCQSHGSSWFLQCTGNAVCTELMYNGLPGRLIGLSLLRPSAYTCVCECVWVFRDESRTLSRSSSVKYDPWPLFTSFSSCLTCLINSKVVCIIITNPNTTTWKTWWRTSQGGILFYFKLFFRSYISFSVQRKKPSKSFRIDKIAKWA